MARHGFNTFTPYARELPEAFGIDNRDGGALLAWHVQTAIDVGLCDSRFPLVCLSCVPGDITSAQARYGAPTWPELVSYNQDEPGLAARDAVAQYAQAAHAAGLRSGTAITGDIALQIGDPLDIWIIHMDSMTEALRAGLPGDKARWLYNCSLRGSNAALHRYWTGVYTWAMAPEVCLTWTYTHDPESRIRPDGTWDLRRVYDTATCDAEGNPLPTVALEGMQEGIIDSRFLQALARLNTPDGNAYLSELRAQVPVAFWPGGRVREYSSYPWDVPDTAVPPIDLVRMRSELVRLLGVAR
jgi:hypothetical protein